MKQTQKPFAMIMLPAMAASIILAPIAASASEEGKRNTTIGLGAAAAALLITQKNKLPGALVGAGAVYSYTQYERDINNRHKRERRAAYRTGYRNGYHTSHRSTRHRYRG